MMGFVLVWAFVTLKSLEFSSFDGGQMTFASFKVSKTRFEKGLINYILTGMGVHFCIKSL